MVQLGRKNCLTPRSIGKHCICHCKESRETNFWKFWSDFVNSNLKIGCGRHIGLMVSVVDSRSSSQGLSPGCSCALCSWERHFTLTVPLFTQVCKWVQANLLLWGNLQWTSIPSRGSWDKLRPDGAHKFGLGNGIFHLPSFLVKVELADWSNFVICIPTDTDTLFKSCLPCFCGWREELIHLTTGPLKLREL